MIRKEEEVGHWCREFIDSCRERGIRITSQRLAVYRSLAEDLSHPTAEALYLRVKKQMPLMSLATLYRTLEFLESENLIKRVSARENAARYDANIAPHQHLICRNCGLHRDFNSLPVSMADIPKLSNFIVEELDVRFMGICGDCAAKSRIISTKNNYQGE